MEKIENKNDIEFVKENLQKGISKRKIAKLLGRAQSYVDRIESEFKKKPNRFIEKDGFEYYAVCKTTNKEFLDYKNSSGILTNHVLEINPNYKKPENYFCRKIFNETGKFWYEDTFFDILEREIAFKETVKCKYCDRITVDLDNKSGMYTTHLKEVHGKSIDDYVSEFPEEKILFKTYFDKKNRIEFVESNPENFITCEECGKKLSTLTHSHLKNIHNMTLEEYKFKYHNSKYHSKNFLDKTTVILKNAIELIETSYVSKPEKEISAFLESFNLIVDGSNRKLIGQEIDLIIHDKKIGIEFNGCKFHTEIFGKKTKFFHLTKTKLMNEKGYKLIHIFEDEWMNKQEIVKSKLKHIFGFNNNKIIHTRKCKIQEIESYQKNSFLNLNHIQGEDKSNIHLGAFFENKLVSVMTFDNKRQMNVKIIEDGAFELKRFATDINYKMSGMANKLLNYFIIKYNPKKIISFADKRWTLSEDNLYTKLNFNKVYDLKPDYSYYKNSIHRTNRLHKFSYGKNSLKEKFPSIYSDDKSEWEIMQEAGFDRIWDCGKFKYELNLTQ